MSSSLVFINVLDEVPLLEGFIDADTTIVSMLPSVSSELKRKKVAYETTLSFFGFEGHHQTLKKSFEIVEELRPMLQKIKIDDVQHAFEKTWIFHFRFHLNYLLAMICIIDTAVQENKPDILISFRSNSTNKTDIKDSENSSLFNKILEQYAFAHNIKIQYQEKNKNTIAQYQEKSKNLIFQNYYWKILKNWTKSCFFEIQLSIFPFIKGNRISILAPEDTYNMPRLFNDIFQANGNFFPVYLSIQRKTLKLRISEMLKGKTFSFLFIPTRTKLVIPNNFQSQLNISLSNVTECLNNHKAKSTFFGVNLTNYLHAYINSTLNHKMLDLECEIISLRKILKTVNPNKVFSQHSLGLSYALGEICLNSNINALLISHGSHTPNNEELAKLEWSIHGHTMINSHYPFVAIQTPWAKKFLNTQSNVVSRSIETGPLLFARKEESEENKIELRKKIFGSTANKHIILHAGTPKDWGSLRPLVFETIDEYVDNINHCIKAIDQLPNLYLAIRFRPQKGITLKDLKMSLIDSDCYGIYIDKSFQDYLLCSDLLLSYSSTAIEEALQNHLTVLQYDPNGKYEHIPGEVLSVKSENKVSEIYSVLAEEDLIPALKWWSDSLRFNNEPILPWSKHILDFDKKMEWLSQMESQKC